MVGTIADASSMSCCMRFETASAVACAWVSSTVIKPIGLSSRTISPVSVIHAVVVRPLNIICTLNAGIGRRSPVVTTSRAPIAIVTGAFFMVAGSNTIHCLLAPATRPSLARRRPTLNISAGGSAS